MLDNVSNSFGLSNNVATKGKTELGKNDFLSLMLTQLKYQDPLEPVEGSEFTAQLAQFSSLEQLTNMSEALTNSVNANYQLTQSVNNTMIAAFIGKEVKLEGQELLYNGQDQGFIGYTLPNNVKSVTIKIYDENGNVVRTMDNVPLSEGEHKLAWDFTNDDGDQMPTGSYGFSVEAKSMSDEDLTIQSYRFGVIDAIRFTESGTALVVNDVEYSLADVFEIINPVSSNTSNGSGR